jgi:hypothetical protein
MLLDRNVYSAGLTNEHFNREPPVRYHHREAAEEHDSITANALSYRMQILWLL